MLMTFDNAISASGLFCPLNHVTLFERLLRWYLQGIQSWAHQRNWNDVCQCYTRVLFCDRSFQRLNTNTFLLSPKNCLADIVVPGLRLQQWLQMDGSREPTEEEKELNMYLLLKTCSHLGSSSPETV